MGCSKWGNFKEEQDSEIKSKHLPCKILIKYKEEKRNIMLSSADSNLTRWSVLTISGVRWDQKTPGWTRLNGHNVVVSHIHEDHGWVTRGTQPLLPSFCSYTSPWMLPDNNWVITQETFFLESNAEGARDRGALCRQSPLKWLPKTSYDNWHKKRHSNRSKCSEILTENLGEKVMLIWV